METLTGLTIFTRVIESGSFSETGRQLGVAPSSVSRQINDLENALGVQLFHRSTRNLSLTEAGELYYDKVTTILADLEDAKLAITQLDGTATGVLRVSAPGGLSPRYIVPLLGKFQELYPGVKVVMLVSDQVLDMIEQRIDLTLRLGKLEDSSLIARKIGTGRRIVCASKLYLKQYGTPDNPEELLRHNCLTFRSNPGSNLWRFKNRKNNQSHDIRVKGNLFINDAASLSAAAVSGQGIVLLPSWLVREELNNDLLLEILSDYEPIPKMTPMYALYPRQRHLPPKVRAFIDFLIENLDPIM